MSRWQAVWREEAKTWYSGSIDGPDAALSKEIVADENYISVFLRAIHIKDFRVGRRRLYGTVVSSCSVVKRDGGRVESMVVTTPSTLRDIDGSNNLDRLITGTVRLLGPVPYRGSGLDLELGLFTMPGRDMLGPYLALLEKAADLISVGIIDQHSGLVGLVKEGLDVVLSTQNSPSLEIGLKTLFDRPATGYIGVIRGTYDGADRLKLNSENRLMRGDHNYVLEPYLVFSVHGDTKRHDWSSIAVLGEAYEWVRNAVRDGDMPRTREALSSFRRSAIFSPDLLTRDGKRLFNLVSDQVSLAMPATATSSPDLEVLMPDFADLPLYETEARVD